MSNEFGHVQTESLIYNTIKNLTRITNTSTCAFQPNTV